MCEWISVKDKSPEEKKLIVINIAGDVLSAEFSGGIFHIASTDGYDGGVADLYEVSHWMPLPEPPK